MSLPHFSHNSCNLSAYACEVTSFGFADTGGDGGVILDPNTPTRKLLEEGDGNYGIKITYRFEQVQLKCTDSNEDDLLDFAVSVGIGWDSDVIQDIIQYPSFELGCWKNHGVTLSIHVDGYSNLEPTVTPVLEPTIAPVLEPPVAPVLQPTIAPVLEPTVAPVLQPTVAPVLEPTMAPVLQPTIAPVLEPTMAPVLQPTVAPVLEPTLSPVQEPTLDPVGIPTRAPTPHPTSSPTNTPTRSPTEKPTETPTSRPTEKPTTSPTEKPTLSPTGKPTMNPTEKPTVSLYAYYIFFYRTSRSTSQIQFIHSQTTPSLNPSTNPSSSPTLLPSGQPTYVLQTVRIPGSISTNKDICSLSGAELQAFTVAALETIVDFACPGKDTCIAAITTVCGEDESRRALKSSLSRQLQVQNWQVEYLVTDYFICERAACSSPSDIAKVSTIVDTVTTNMNGSMGSGQFREMLSIKIIQSPTLDDSLVECFMVWGVVGLAETEIGGSSSGTGVFYPDWVYHTGTCLQDGKEPDYMKNSTTWLFSTLEECCSRFYSGWNHNKCMNPNGSGLWYVSHMNGKCVTDCEVGNGETCGGFANLLDFDLYFNPRSCCESELFYRFIEFCEVSTGCH